MLVMMRKWRVTLIRILEKLEKSTSKNSSKSKKNFRRKLINMIKKLKMKPTRTWLNSLECTAITVSESLRTSTLESVFITRELDKLPSTNMLIRCTILLPEKLKITWSNKPRLSSSHQKKTLTNISVTSMSRITMVMKLATSLNKSVNLKLENSMKCGLRLRTITQLRSKDFLNWEPKVVPPKRTLRRCLKSWIATLNSS